MSAKAHNSLTSAFMGNEPKIIATYRIQCPTDKAAELARAMAWEQTVEVVESVVSAQVERDVVGEVLDIVKQNDGSHLARIAYHSWLASDQIGQLFNLVYGNVSLYPLIRLENLSIPGALANRIGGPRFGNDGVRAMLGVFDRPLLATVLKPRGESIEYFQQIAHNFILGGGDILKDDQNLAEADFEQFRQRVTACAQTIEQTSQQRGRPCLYFPHVTGAGDDLKRRLAVVESLNLSGVLLCPWVLGLGLCKDLSAEFNLAYMAHPSLAGTFTRPPAHGITAEVLYGTLLRLGGADISVFPGHGGRISSREVTCDHIHHALADPLGDCHQSLPCPAGGKHLNLIPEMLDEYGDNAVFLVGGALLAHGPDLQASTREYMAAIQQRYPGQIKAAISNKPVETPPLIMRSEQKGRWHNRQQTAYKTDQTLPHANASRTELIGGDEQTHFELRYFELQPGGFTSLEKHLHTHVIIGVQGIGRLLVDNQQQDFSEHDIAYIPPSSVHQLRNNSDKVFGFYCLVDRNRDKPQAVDRTCSRAAD